ncbi:signal peptidase I [Priestia megaterium]|uniref:signal peptidase I n=1 Tax=Priestia megaterium TaxID=1404 RepID=UPI001BE65C5F|nr:signal peptidase I [Priestia megaterium]MBT2257908.1 signal peptidase I [Priestia megaterium]MBT2277701.1 signal peptidase I [Priestia megaterium]
MSINQESILLLKSVIEKKGHVHFPSEGFSMYPCIRQNDLCTFEKASVLKKGDIVLFHTKSGQLIAHRLVRIRHQNEQMQYIFKGDTNLYCDEPVMGEQIIGKLTAISRENQKKAYMVAPFDYMWSWLMLFFPFSSRFLKRYINQKIAN